MQLARRVFGFSSTGASDAADSTVVRLNGTLGEANLLDAAHRETWLWRSKFVAPSVPNSGVFGTCLEVTFLGERCIPRGENRNSLASSPALVKPCTIFDDFIFFAGRNERNDCKISGI
ncbi:hypothetical protein JTB14_002284 [Gonioctena quinquepunctata]|nr:hypothetical protein JTB14_002284 [Gonioctena quinquepunctata]